MWSYKASKTFRGSYKDLSLSSWKTDPFSRKDVQWFWYKTKLLRPARKRLLSWTARSGDASHGCHLASFPTRNASPNFNGRWVALSIAFLGNLLIVLTIVSNKTMRTLAHLFFATLNIAGHATEHLLNEQALIKRDILYAIQTYNGSKIGSVRRVHVLKDW